MVSWYDCVARLWAQVAGCIGRRFGAKYRSSAYCCFVIPFTFSKTLQVGRQRTAELMVIMYNGRTDPVACVMLSESIYSWKSIDKCQHTAPVPGVKSRYIHKNRISFPTVIWGVKCRLSSHILINSRILRAGRSWRDVLTTRACLSTSHRNAGPSPRWARPASTSDLDIRSGRLDSSSYTYMGVSIVWSRECGSLPARVISVMGTPLE